ncbi:MAG: GNAT family N-acetyltransferase [Deltaproteobacteria bacterium CG_4_10_14_0_2_um_filter_43_8]|nr:MAG: GNAT family N-acetyltransferase [Deltaproteobacteria bacterium CG11_big_fil_rev_8_21_14_0_20_42_23]PJA21353.1 MAG: GNAT family N-acetyltransferase [Deltaproteobacteria bacterium CG_4_10_14_0_2_um_filter_43_8]PJC64813.1 MAG: GNAT family N-acetyltransferase [Deltaproteobacteria bacterium CG_4_9_14_0_2_um_filter_42_21]
MNITYRFITRDDPEHQMELELRYQVMRKPLGMRRDEVTFPFEADALRLAALENKELVGCVLFKADENKTSGKLFQMVVSTQHQKKGIGKKLVEILEAKLKTDGIQLIHLHARKEAIPFYKHLGYVCEGEEFLEINIPHSRMVKRI